MIDSLDNADQVEALEQKGLKYPTPNVKELDMAVYVSSEELRILGVHLEGMVNGEGDERKTLYHAVCLAIDKQQG